MTKLIGLLPLPELLRPGYIKAALYTMKTIATLCDVFPVDNKARTTTMRLSNRLVAIFV